MAGAQPAGAGSRPNHAEVAPDVGRFAIEKVYRLQIAGMEEWVEHVAHRGDVLGLKHQSIRSALENMHPVYCFAGQIVRLLKVNARSLPDFIR